jgi:thymidylate synthase
VDGNSGVEVAADRNCEESRLGVHDGCARESKDIGDKGTVVMYYEAETLDDLMRTIFNELLKPQAKLKATREYSFTERCGVLLKLSNPRARLSRTETKGKIFSALGELLWYLSGQNSAAFMDYYVPNGIYSKEAEEGGDSVRSGYGERINNFDGVNQIENIISLLKEKSTSRRAVIQLFDATDLAQPYKSIPCTCTIQFLIREQRLSLFVNMRSNDAFLGLPHDIFAFTMLQEIIARSVGVELGEYKHTVGSLHLYEKDETAAQRFLSEDWQEKTPMPDMPSGDPWHSIREVQVIEQSLREGAANLPLISELDPYWQDICRLLYAHRLSKDGNLSELKRVRGLMASRSYFTFIDTKIDAAVNSSETSARVHTIEHGT